MKHYNKDKVTDLTPAEMEEILKGCLDPAEPNENLKKAYENYKKVMSEGKVRIIKAQDD